MPTELHAQNDTGLVPLSAAGLAAKNRNGIAHSPSTGSHASHASQASSISRMSHTSAQRPGISPVHTPRADSPSLGESAAGTEGRARRARVGSQISVVSDSERGHLRGISDTSVSTEGNYATPMDPPTSTTREAVAETPSGRPGAVSPLTPPQPVHESSDYLGVGSPVSGGSKRKSQFSEKLDEVDEK
jgi:hypothetical protein